MMKYIPSRFTGITRCFFAIVIAMAVLLTSSANSFAISPANNSTVSFQAVVATDARLTDSAGNVIAGIFDLQPVGLGILAGTVVPTDGITRGIAIVELAAADTFLFLIGGEPIIGLGSSGTFFVPVGGPFQWFDTTGNSGSILVP